MRKIILTGSTGFIGSAVLRQIIKNGDLPILLLRPESNTTRLSGLTGYETIYYDDIGQTTLKSSLRALEPDGFIHLAWRGTAGRDRNEQYQITENIQMALQSVELANAVECRQWIGIGSQAEYGNPNRKVAETAATLPTTLYGKAKLATCWASLGLCESLEMKGSWIRVFSTYGPDDNPDWFLPYLIRELRAGNTPNLTKCEQIWDFLHVTDAANAILSVLNAEVEGIFNIGSGQGVPLRNVAETVRVAVNSHSIINYGAMPYRPDQVMHLEADISKVNQQTGWLPMIKIKEGIDGLLEI